MPETGSTSAAFFQTDDMRTTVLDEGKHFDRQTHAYAEYRVFATLAGDGSSPRDVTITLTRMEAYDSSGSPVVCTVAVTTACGELTQVHALERHAYGAIDRAAELIAKAVRRRRKPGPAIPARNETARSSPRRRR